MLTLYDQRKHEEWKESRKKINIPETIDEKPELPVLFIDNKRLSRLLSGDELSPDAPRSVPPAWNNK